MEQKDAVMVLTSKSLTTMVEEGGSGNWRATEDHIRRCRWVIGVRNRHSDWSQGTEEHATAFLIGRIVGVKPSPPEEVEGRLVIVFDEYAELDIPEAWPPNHRNPVAYVNLEDLKIEPDKLDWKKFPGSSSKTMTESYNAASPAIVFEKAKGMIAAALSISPTAIQVRITV